MDNNAAPIRFNTLDQICQLWCYNIILQKECFKNQCVASVMDITCVYLRFC